MDSPILSQPVARKRDSRHLEDVCALETWSSTQKVVSLSSAESEYCSMVRCASEAIGLANTIRELRHEAHVRIWTDAAVARGLALRSGSGAIKHMETKYFWLQQKENDQELTIQKIRGTVNPADLMTEHLEGKRLMMLCDLFEHQTHRQSTDFSSEADDGS